VWTLGRRVQSRRRHEQKDRIRSQRKIGSLRSFGEKVVRILRRSCQNVDKKSEVVVRVSAVVSTCGAFCGPVTPLPCPASLGYGWVGVELADGVSTRMPARVARMTVGLAPRRNDLWPLETSLGLQCFIIYSFLCVFVRRPGTSIEAMAAMAIGDHFSSFFTLR
jgi:hypothetical protein